MEEKELEEKEIEKKKMEERDQGKERWRRTNGR